MTKIKTIEDLERIKNGTNVESDLFWEQYNTFIDKGFHAFYDQFLKMNQQKDGIESYSKFVDLLVNYYKGNTL